MKHSGNVFKRQAVLLGLCSVVLIVCGLYAGAAPTPNVGKHPRARGMGTLFPSRAVIRPSAALAGGDTCATPTVISALPYNDSGDTGTATNSLLFLSNACAGGGAGTREGPDLIYSFTVGSGNSLTFTVTPGTAWDPAIYILGTCGTGGSCVVASDVGFEGQPDTIGPITLPIGTYFFYVDSAFPADDKLGQGPYALNVSGTFGNLGANSSFYTLAPCRVLDTRDPNGPYGGPALTAGVTRTFTIVGRCEVPVDARSISVNATITQPAAQGHVILFPGGTSVPPVSTLNFRAGQTRANNAIVLLGSGGTLSAVSSSTTHFILDVNGYFK